VAFDFYQRKIPGPLEHLVQERADNSEIHNLLAARMEVTASPFPHDVQDKEAINKYQQMYVAAIALPHILQ
jgi:hypothetical protein